VTRFRSAFLSGLAVFVLSAVAAEPQLSSSGSAPQPATGAADATSPARMRLISQDQYFKTLGYIFGPDASIAAHFAPFRRTEGLLASGGAFAGVTPGQMQEFQRTASALSEKIVSPQYRSFIVPCTPRRADAADKNCAKKFLAPVGRLLYRRPLSTAMEAELVDKAGVAARSLKDFYAGLAVALEGMLLAPEVLFIVDRTEPDPDRPGRLRLDSYSLASRLSFFLWNAAPDDELLKAAERGELHAPEGLAKSVDRMIASPRLEAGVRAFFDDMLAFDDFAVIAKDPGIYPAFNGDTLEDAREQTLRTLVDHLIVKKRDYRDLFTTRETFISPSLAAIYGVPAPPGWTSYQTPADTPRVGLLTQISFLAGHAHPGRSSPTLRGKALRELLLCQVVPRPPPNVDFSLLEDPKSVLRTARERLHAHQSNPVCAGCHKVTDPIGLALENFDGAGQYRDTERGAAIDASGSLDGKSFKDAAGLGAALRDNPALPACLVKRLYSYGTGGPAKADEQGVLANLRERFAADGYKLPELMRTVALSPSFSNISAPKSEAPPAKAASIAGPPTGDLLK
jgi:Protein of unknown function (DUF1592)/Protein of unknown function (DUF1588)/Protein of unknown function (DUF1585)